MASSKQRAAKHPLWLASSFVAWTKRVILKSLVHGHRVGSQDGSRIANLQALKPFTPQKISPTEM